MIDFSSTEDKIYNFARRNNLLPGNVSQIEAKPVIAKILKSYRVFVGTKKFPPFKTKNLASTGGALIRAIVGSLEGEVSFLEVTNYLRALELMANQGKIEYQIYDPGSDFITNPIAEKFKNAAEPVGEYVKNLSNKILIGGLALGAFAIYLRSK